MASVTREDEFPEPELRPMHELDVPVVVAVERSSYQFPWSEGIFRDCLRVGYVCRVVEVGGDRVGAEECFAQSNEPVVSVDADPHHIRELA